MSKIKIRLSSSKIDCFKQCERKYWYQYIVYAPRKRLQFYAIRGNFVHIVLEKWVKLMMRGIEEKEAMRQAYKHTYNTYYNYERESLNLLDMKEIKPWLKECLINYQQNRFEPISVEREVGFTYRHIRLIGKVDRIDKVDDNTIKIVDYKTSKNPDRLKNFQLGLYHLGVKYGSLAKKCGDKNIQTSFVLVQQKAKEKSHNFSVPELSGILDEVESVADNILGHKGPEKEHWQPTDSPLCSYCDYCMKCKSDKSQWKLG